MALEWERGFSSYCQSYLNFEEAGQPMTHKRQNAGPINDYRINLTKRATQVSVMIPILLGLGVILSGGLMLGLEGSQGWDKTDILQLPALFWILYIVLNLCPVGIVALRLRLGIVPAKKSQKNLFIGMMLLLIVLFVAFSGSQHFENGRDLITLSERWLLLFIGVYALALPYLLPYLLPSVAKRQKRR